ncbi:MAG: PqqD family protein [Syntrophomonadaceae bacterium]
MKISKEFSLMNIAEVNVVVPLGTKNVNFNKMISLNNSGAFLWRQLEIEKTEEELLNAMLNEYEIDETIALKDIKGFICKLKKVGILE